MKPIPHPIQTPSVTGETKSVRFMALLAPSVSDTLAELAKAGRTSKNAVIETAILALAKNGTLK